MHPYTTLPSGMTQCARCGTSIAMATADYDARGAMVCSSCAHANDLEATEGRAVTAMRGIAYANPLLALGGWVFNPFFAVTVVVLINTVYVLRSLDDPWYKRRVRSRFAVGVAAASGAILTLLPFALYLVMKL